MTEVFNFALVLDCFDRPLDQVEDALFEAGCDDAVLCFRGTTPVLEFDRESATFSEALLSALQNTMDAGIYPVRIEPDDLVPAAEIARRGGITREAVRLWSKGLRGEGFPSPRAIVGKSKIWSWLEVAQWLVESGKISKNSADSAASVAGFNLALEMNRAQRNVDVWSATNKLLADSRIAG